MSLETKDLSLSLRLSLWLVWIGIACAIIFIAGAKVDQQTQIMMAIIVVGLLFVLRWFDDSQISRVVFLTLAGFLVVRYLIWRTMTTLTYHDTVSFTIAIILYFAELFGVVSFFLGIFVNVRPKRNTPEPLPEDTSLWPTVDVFIPTYDEPIRILENTVHAAVQMKYPKDRFRIHLLDDGGTAQKLNQADPTKSKSAANRVRELKELCEATGAIYRTREKNEHAKAGNLNVAFHDTSGELILILDADHVPSQDFLINTTGRFLTNPKLFLVQTPHFALNPDPIEKNLRTFAHMPSEQEMFYNQVQFGIDSWGSSSFCGSAAVLRRSCLEEVGGICGETITEDAETSIELHSRGYESEYFGRPMIAGLAPQTLQAFIVQRSRWAVGMIQILILKNPLFKRGLNLAQRLCYLSLSLYWFFPFIRLIYLLAPCAFLVFGLKIYSANWQSVLTYSLPYVVAIMMTTNFIHGRTRWPFISDIYEVVQCLQLFPSILGAIFRPRSPVFKVTPKVDSPDRSYISSMGLPVQFLFLLTLVIISIGVYRLYMIPESAYPSVVTLFWATLNLVFIGAAMGAVAERRASSREGAISVSYRGYLVSGDESVPCEVKEFMGRRCFVESPFASRVLSADGDLLKLKVVEKEGSICEFGVRYRERRPSEEIEPVSRHELILVADSPQETADRVRLSYGDSQRWVDFQTKRQRKLSILFAAPLLVFVSISGLVHHLSVLLRINRESSARHARELGTLANTGVAERL